MTLNEVESAFRAIKSDLGTRPIYHQLDSRIESHLFISVLSYSILKALLIAFVNLVIIMQIGNHPQEIIQPHARDNYSKIKGWKNVSYTSDRYPLKKKQRRFYDILEMKTIENRIIKRILISFVVPKFKTGFVVFQ